MKAGDIVRHYGGGLYTVARVNRSDDTVCLQRGEEWPDAEEWVVNYPLRSLTLVQECDPCITFLCYLTEWQRRVRMNWPTRAKTGACAWGFE